MSKARLIGAGAGGTQFGVLTSINQGGGNKKQGLVSTTNTRVELNYHIRTQGGGHNRNWIFCMNQLGGVGHRWGQAAGPGNRGGVSGGCAALAAQSRCDFPVGNSCSQLTPAQQRALRAVAAIQKYMLSGPAPARTGELNAPYLPASITVSAQATVKPSGSCPAEFNKQTLRLLSPALQPREQLDSAGWVATQDPGTGNGVRVWSKGAAEAIGPPAPAPGVLVVHEADDKTCTTYSFRAAGGCAPATSFEGTRIFVKGSVSKPGYRSDGCGTTVITFYDATFGPFPPGN